MMLRYALGQSAAADKIEAAVRTAIDRGYRTGDIWSEGCSRVGTRGMGDAVLQALE
jgi:3-isopropylmalate dehydrogenase